MTIVPAALLLTCLYVCLAVLSRTQDALAWFLGMMFSAFVCLGWAFQRAHTIGGGTVLTVAALFHVIGMFGLPLFEDDHYRYLWDGYRFVESGSPYGVAPAEFFDDPTVPAAMRRVLDGINYPDIATIYAPLLQAMYGLGYLIAPAELWPVKVLLMIADLGLIALMLRSVPPRMVLLFAWNPLVFKEVALTAHPDALLALPLLLAWQCRHIGRTWLNGVFFGLALAVKISALPAMAWLLWNKRYWAVPLAGLTLLASYMPFVGTANDLPGLFAFAEGWQFNAAAYAWLLVILDADQAKLACALIAAIAMFLIQYRERASDACPPWHRVFGVLLLFSPVINAWYLLWLLPFAVYSREIWPWATSAAVCLSYVTGLNTGREEMAAFEVLPWAQTLEWLLIGVAVSIDLGAWLRRRAAVTHDSKIVQAGLDGPELDGADPAQAVRRRRDTIGMDAHPIAQPPPLS